jgi:hypothetical protein
MEVKLLSIAGAIEGHGQGLLIPSFILPENRCLLSAVVQVSSLWSCELDFVQCHIDHSSTLHIQPVLTESSAPSRQLVPALLTELE